MMHVTTDGTLGFDCGNCNCPTDECRYRTIHLDPYPVSNSASTIWTFNVPAETEWEREERELLKGLEEAFAWRRARTRKGWFQRPSLTLPPSKVVRSFKDFQRRPGRPSRFRGHGGQSPFRSRPHFAGVRL